MFITFYFVLANVSCWSLILHGTATPPPIDLIGQNKQTEPNVPENPAEDFDHNSIDTDSPNAFWKPDAEVFMPIY